MAEPLLDPSPSAAPYRPAVEIESLGNFIADPVEPARFPQHILRYRNQRAAEEVGLDRLSEAQWLAHFARFEPLPANLPQPLALRYHGHQFGIYNPDLGDGRGFLFAQLRDRAGRLMDLGTKGSGQTPYSRLGDGRLTLKGAVREVLATEMLQALGVDTSRTFSVVETGEQLIRGDEPSPTRSAVLVRLSHGHIRIGTFERLAVLGSAEEMERLTRWCLAAYFGEESPECPAALLMERTVAAVARTSGAMMAAGFVHGVLNSDNINISGELFDYGPWRFLPRWDPRLVAAYFDQAGRYAFGNQPGAMHWNLAQFARSLRVIEAAEPLIAALEKFPDLYSTAYVVQFLWRLGIAPEEPAADAALVEAFERAMIASAIDPALFFQQWMGRTAAPVDASPGFTEATQLLSGRRAVRDRSHPYWSGPPCTMTIDEVERIWAAIAERDDWSPFAAKLDEVRAMGAALASPPSPGRLDLGDQAGIYASDSLP